MDVYTFLITLLSTLAFFATLVTLVVVGGNNRDRLAELAINILGKKSETPHTLRMMRETLGKLI